MNRKFIIAGNWKMNTTINSCVPIINNIISELNNISEIKNSIIICPPFTNLTQVGNEISKYNKNNMFLGAQNCYHQPKGAFTGEISIEMLTALNCQYIIVGHSERRAYFCETDAEINKKILALLASGVTPILCIGETLEERKSENTFNILKSQLDACLKGIPKEKISEVVVAYEPVWAIGTGISATVQEIEEAHNWLREYFTKNYSEIGEEVYLLYGGSLNNNNAPQILSVHNVNGGLIGGASLEADKFISIIKTSEELSK